MQTEIEVDDTEYSAPCDDEETLKVIKPAEDDPVIGIFVCDETSDRYIFYDDGTGNFRTGGEETEFVWRHSDGLVIVTFLTFGKEYLHYDKEKRILQELAAQSSCVVAGRAGFIVFREWPNHLNVFIQASMEHRVKRVMRRQDVSEQEARDIIAKMDATREAYIKKYEDTSRYDTRNYQLVISMDDLSEDDAAEVIMDYINRTSK